MKREKKKMIMGNTLRRKRLLLEKKKMTETDRLSQKMSFAHYVISKQQVKRF